MALSKRVRIRYEIDSRQAERGLERLGRGTDSARSRIASFGKTMATVGVAAATAAATAAVGMVRLAESAAETANEIAKTSRGLGVASDEMQRLAFAASRESTLSVEQFNKSVTALTVGLEDAVQKGTGPAADGLRTLGLTVRELDGLGIEGQIGAIADAINRLPNEQQRAAVSAQLFGRRNGPQMAALLKQGSSGIKALGDEAERMGLVLDRKALKASEEFVDSMSDVKATVGAVARDIGIALGPEIKKIADDIKEWTIENRHLIEQEIPDLMETTASAMREMVDTGAEAVSTFNKMAKAAEGLGSTLGPVGEKLYEIVKFNASGGILGWAVRGSIANEARGGLGAAIEANRIRGAGVDNPLGLDIMGGLRGAANSVAQRLQQRQTNGGGKGGRRDPYLQERLEFQRQLTAALNAERMREFSEATSLQRTYLQDVRQFQAELAAAQQPELDRMAMVREELARTAELENIRLQRAIELANVNGDPAEAFALEQERLRLREEALRRQLELETQVGERERIADEVEQVRHEATVSRILEEQRVREEAERRKAQLMQDSITLSKNSIALSGAVADAAISGGKREEKARRAVAAAGLVVDGTVWGVKAVGAFAAQNYVQGAAYLAASATAFTKAATLGGGGSGGAGASTAGTATQFARGTAPQRAEFSVERGAPLSIQEGTEGNPRNTGRGQSRGGSSRTVVIQRIEVLGAIDDDSANKIRKGLQRVEANLGG